MLSNPLWSFAKLLSSHITFYSFKEINELFIDTAKRRDISSVLNSIYDSEKNLNKDFNLLLAYELMCSIGREAEDDLWVGEHFAKITSREVPLERRHLDKLNPKLISIELPTAAHLNIYDTHVAIPKLQKVLGQTLDYLLDANLLTDKDLKDLHDLRNLFAKKSLLQ